MFVQGIGIVLIVLVCSSPVPADELVGDRPGFTIIKDAGNGTGSGDTVDENFFGAGVVTRF